MPPIAAVIGAIGSGIGAAGSAVLAAGGSALGGLTSAGGAALGGLTSAGGAALAAAPKVLAAAPKVAGVVQAGRQVYGMFQTPEGQPTTVQPTTVTPQPIPYQATPTNILNTLPNLIRPAPAQPQIMTTPPILPSAEGPGQLMKYAPLIGLAVIGYLILKAKK